MSPLTFILYLVYTVTSVSGLALIKSWLPKVISNHAASEFVWSSVALFGIGVLLYISSFGLWMIILLRSPLSTAYPVAIGLTLIFTTIVAATLLHETIGVEKILGIGLILAGIVLIFGESL